MWVPKWCASNNLHQLVAHCQRLSVTNTLDYLKGQLYNLACKRKILLIIQMPSVT